MTWRILGTLLYARKQESFTTLKAPKVACTNIVKKQPSKVKAIDAAFWDAIVVITNGFLPNGSTVVAEHCLFLYGDVCDKPFVRRGQVYWEKEWSFSKIMPDPLKPQINKISCQNEPRSRFQHLFVGQTHFSAISIPSFRRRSWRQSRQWAQHPAACSSLRVGDFVILYKFV